jgi:hypothetical protein
LIFDINNIVWWNVIINQQIIITDIRLIDVDVITLNKVVFLQQRIIGFFIFLQITILGFG